MYTNQTEELRALSLQEMEETNGGGCLVNMIGSGGGIVLTAVEAAFLGATIFTVGAAALGIAMLVAAAVDCES